MAKDFSHARFGGNASSARAVGSIAICFAFVANGHPPPGNWRSTSAWTRSNQICWAFPTACF